MNLVISGPIDDTLRNLVVALSRPRRVVSLHAKADRLEGVDDGMDVKSQVAALCDAARVDHAYVEEGVRFADFKLLAMDMDSTLITIECIDEIADFAGKKKEVAAITAAAMRGELDFAESLRRRVALLAGVNKKTFNEIFEHRLTLSPGAMMLLKTAKNHGIYIILVSGGFTYFTNRLRRILPIDETHANSLEYDNNCSLTGKIKGPIFDGLSKRLAVIKRIQNINCEKSEVIVVGDGSNDLPMMELSKYSIAYQATTIVQIKANYRINYSPLTTIIDYFSHS